MRSEGNLGIAFQVTENSLFIPLKLSFYSTINCRRMRRRTGMNGRCHTVSENCPLSTCTLNSRPLFPIQEKENTFRSSMTNSHTTSIHKEFLTLFTVFSLFGSFIIVGQFVFYSYKTHTPSPENESAFDLR